MQEHEVGGAKLRRRASSEPAVEHGNIPVVGSRFGSLGVQPPLLFAFFRHFLKMFFILLTFYNQIPC